MSFDPHKQNGLLGRLVRDIRANTLAIAAAAVIPLIGVIGGGVDASRMYLAKSRLQQACDSATLAARKKLAGDSISNGNIPSDIVTMADNFFDNNFQTGVYGTESAEYTLSASTATRMDGNATVEVPTTLMAVFGYNKIDVAVDCSAELNLPNIDVMLVLDNSGSMRNSRIAALKSAVFSFYDEVMRVKPEDARVRIGVVPYNAAVNVGDLLMDKNADFISDSWTYQSREALFVDVSNNDGVAVGDQIVMSDQNELLPRYSSQLGSSNNSYYHWDRQSSSDQNACNNYDGNYTVSGVTWVISNTNWSRNYWGSSWSRSQRAACIARVRKYRTAGPSDVRPNTYRKVFDRYSYRAMPFDTSSFKYGNNVSTPTGTQGANVSSRWNGCIEERTTVATTNFDPIPSGALDLDIDLIPDAADLDTQWRPQWPQITYDRGGPAEWRTTSNIGTRGYSCPVAATKLQEWPLNGSSRNSAFESYINGMDAVGYTMHDMGMLWGGRLISPDGIFGDENDEAPNGDSISRHIIFMTDGLTEPGPANTGGYGNYDMDGRLAGFAANGTWRTEDLEPIHNSRLDAICAQLKNKNITIWTITFGLSQTTHTRNCATGDSRAFEASSSAQLIAAFTQIATSIAELRLVQ
ncbi:MAG: pilus assembly protein TadG-related protein [Pontixanthobacter sp.]